MSLFSHLSVSAKEGESFKPYPAPKISALDQEGQSVNLDSYYQSGYTLVYFYPKADTPGCTAQACSLRDGYEKLTQAGVKVIGVSTDKVESQKKFATKYKLPFTLLADPEGKVLKAFGVKKIPLVGMSTRQAFLIKNGQVIWRDENASTSDQADDVLKVVKS